MLRSGPFRFAVGLWPLAPLPLDPAGPAAELAKSVRTMTATTSAILFELSREVSTLSSFLGRDHQYRTDLVATHLGVAHGQAVERGGAGDGL